MIMLTPPGGEPFEVARVRNVPISIGQSWPYLLITLLVVLLADEDIGPETIVAFGKTAAIWWGCLIAAVAIHEAGHVLMALVLRAPVGPIVLDIWSGHLDHRLRSAPGRTMLVAVAGPLANLATAVISYYNREVAAWSLTIVPFMVLNLGLFLYHILPGLPQDGGHVVSGVVRWLTQSTTSGLEVGAWAGRFVIIAAAGVFMVAPIFLGGHLPRPIDIIWVGLLVIVLWRSTSRVLKVVRRRHLTDEILTRAVTRPTETVPRHTRLDIVDASYPRGSAVLVLDGAEQPIGILVVGAGPAERRDVLTAGDVMIPPPGKRWVQAASLDADVSDQAEVLVENGYPVIAVRTDQGRYGLIWRAVLDREVERQGSPFGPRRARLGVRGG
jgi:Zn-dependent protease